MCSKDKKFSDQEVINIDFERSNKNILRTRKTIKIFKYDKNTFNNMLAKNMIYEDNKDLNENVKLFYACLESTIQGFTFEK